MAEAKDNIDFQNFLVLSSWVQLQKDEDKENHCEEFGLGDD